MGTDSIVERVDINILTIVPFIQCVTNLFAGFLNSSLSFQLFWKGLPGPQNKINFRLYFIPSVKKALRTNHNSGCAIMLLCTLFDHQFALVYVKTKLLNIYLLKHYQ